MIISSTQIIETVVWTNLRMCLQDGEEQNSTRQKTFTFKRSKNWNITSDDDDDKQEDNNKAKLHNNFEE